MTQIVTAEVQAYDPAIPGVRSLYFATQAFVTGPGDTPANAYFDGRISVPPNVQRFCWAADSTTGRTEIGFGDLILANPDGALDALIGFSFVGRRILIRLGEVTPRSGGVPTWTTVLDGTMEQAEFSWREIRIRVRDRLQDLTKPHIQARFAGTNSLPNGIEGVFGDLSGQCKPRIYGQVYNVAMPCVNTTRLIYLAHWGAAPLASVDAVFDRGAALTRGADYASQTDMESNAPNSGQFRVWNASTATYFRIGSNPQGTVTADLTQGANAAARTVGQVFSSMLQDAGISAGSISSADVAALDAAAPAVVGFAFTHREETTTIEAIDAVTQSVGAWFAPDASGVWRIGRLAVPTGPGVGTITATDVISIDRVPSRDPGVGVPAWKVKVGYSRVWEVQDDLTSSATMARKGFVDQAYRRTEATDSSVKTANLTSPEIVRTTLLTTKADADAEAARLLAIYKARRDFLRVRVRVDSGLAAALDIGRTVVLQLPRFGMGAGKAFLIIGIRTDMRGYIFELTLWG